MPGFRVRVLAQNSALGTVNCKSPSAGTHTASTRLPTSPPSTARRRYSYSRPAPSMGRSSRSRAGNTAAESPSACRSAAARLASASPAVTTHRGRPSRRLSCTASAMRPAGGRPNSAVTPGPDSPSSSRANSAVEENREAKGSDRTGMGLCSFRGVVNGAGRAALRLFGSHPLLNGCTCSAPRPACRPSAGGRRPRRPGSGRRWPYGPRRRACPAPSRPGRSPGGACGPRPCAPG